MIDKRIEDISEADIQALIDNEERESKTLDYKEALSTDPFDLLKDISAFANTTGGDIIYGVTEVRDPKDNKPTGVPKELVGLSGVNVDAEILRLEQQLRSGIEPKIPQLRLRSIKLKNGSEALIIRVGDSWLKPHYICHRASPRFFTRTSAGNNPLDYNEIRDLFVGSAELPKRLREFRDQRLARVLSGDMLYPMAQTPITVFHFLPIESFRLSRKVDLTGFQNSQKRFPVSNGITGWHRNNLDGVAYYHLGAPPHEDMCGYSQLFHSGIVEIVDGYSIYGGDDGRTTPPYVFEQSVQKAITSSVDCLRALGITSEVYLFLSILNVGGFRLYEKGTRYGMEKRVDRNHLLFPEFRMEIDQPIDGVFKQVADSFWQAFGAKGSPNFDNKGTWTGQAAI